MRVYALTVLDQPTNKGVVVSVHQTELKAAEARDQYIAMTTALGAVLDAEDVVVIEMETK